MQMEPGFNFKKEYPTLDKALTILGPYLAALVAAAIVMGIQAILPIYMIWAALLTLAQSDPSYAIYIFPGLAAIVTLYLDHERKKTHNRRFISSHRNPNVPFYDDPRQPMPHYRPKDEEEHEPPESPDA